MSQRIIETKNYQAISGWDRPLQYFFLVVLNWEGEIIFSNLCHSNPAMSLNEINNELEELSISPPEEFWDDLKDDCSNNHGNVFKTYKLNN